MEITEVRVKLVDGGQDKLRAFCSITIDDSFVVRDLKVIEGTKGLFVAMPSRKLTTRCQRCGFKNQVRSNYCNECGTTLPPEMSQRVDGRGKLHADIAHPINTECRERLQARVVESYLDEVDASKQPGYRPRDLEDSDEEYPPESVVAGVRGEGVGDRPAPRGPEPLPERPRERGAERSPERVPDLSPLVADRTFSERAVPERAVPERAVSERTPNERIGPDRTAAERGPSVRGPSGWIGSERSSPERGAPDLGTPDRSSIDRRTPDRPVADRGGADRLAGESPRRPSGRGRGPLAEMPPPDDNFSAGIF